MSKAASERLCAVMSILIILSTAAHADSTSIASAVLQRSGVEIAAFGDFRAHVNDWESSDRFEIGQAEMGLAYELNAQARSQMTIAYADNAFGIGSFTLEYDVLALDTENDVSPSLVVRAGQFDIPIGIDWHCYASPDRDLISTPRMVSGLHGAWNDLGVALDWHSQFTHVAVFAANGFCFDGISDQGEELHTENHLALGGRIGVLPVAAAELGCSFARVLGRSGTADIDLMGADLQLEAGSFSLRAEIMREQFAGGYQLGLHNTGYYLEVSREFGNWILTAQREHVWLDLAQTEDYSGVTFGISRSLGERLTARWETRYDLIRDNYQGIGQLVMKF